MWPCHIVKDKGEKMTKQEFDVFKNSYYAKSRNTRFDQMLDECKKQVLQSIVNPFGLGAILSAYDKTGGNVDTVHNVRRGIYATQEERDAYDNRGQYDSKSYHGDENYKAINRQYSELKNQGEAIDYMTGRKIDLNQKTDLDHIVSAKEIHNDAGRVLAEMRGEDLANTESNLALTDRSLNRSKQDKTMTDYLKRRDERLANIHALEQKRELKPNEQKELEKLRKQQKIDDAKALEADKKSRDKINTSINKAHYESRKFAVATLRTSSFEGIKMGGQQVLALIMVEFFSTLFDEIHDMYHKGILLEEKGLFESLKERICRIAEKIKKKIEEKYGELVRIFGAGFLSGFASNLATTMINIFATTSKRLVRIIREGIFSFIRAIKLIIFPPKNLTKEEIWLEAQKLIVSGVIVGFGVLIEQAINEFLIYIGMISFAGILTSVFVGAITGIVIAVAMYWLDTRQKSIEQMRYEEISKLVAENLPALIEEREELENIVIEIHQNRLHTLEKSFADYCAAYDCRDDKSIYDALNKICDLWGKELKIKTIQDVQNILENPNRTGELKW